MDPNLPAVESILEVIAEYVAAMPAPGAVAVGMSLEAFSYPRASSHAPSCPSSGLKRTPTPTSTSTSTLPFSSPLSPFPHFQQPTRTQQQILRSLAARMEAAPGWSQRKVTKPAKGTGPRGDIMIVRKPLPVEIQAALRRYRTILHLNPIHFIDSLVAHPAAYFIAGSLFHSFCKSVLVIWSYFDSSRFTRLDIATTKQM